MARSGPKIYSKPIKFNPFGKEIQVVYGPYKSAKDKRARLVFWFVDGSTTTMLRSRWKMIQHLRRNLEQNEDVDHKDNNPFNDKLSNLQLMTKQENTQKAALYLGKHVHPHGSYYTCDTCGAPVTIYQNRCVPCYRKSTEKINWPDTSELKERLKHTSFLALGRELGVSDNAIRKRLKTHPE